MKLGHSAQAVPPVYACRFSPIGSRVLYRDGRAVARNLRTEADVSRAILRDRARLVLAALPLPQCAARRAWRAMRGAIAGFALTSGERYRLLRERMGRLRDLRDPRQMTLLRDDT